MGTFLLMLACKVNIFYRSIFTCNIKYFKARSQLIAFRGATATVIDFKKLKFLLDKKVIKKDYSRIKISFCSRAKIWLNR